MDRTLVSHSCLYDQIIRSIQYQDSVEQKRERGQKERKKNKAKKASDIKWTTGITVQ
jgi:hypothetical protein